MKLQPTTAEEIREQRRKNKREIDRALDQHAKELLEILERREERGHE
jgi:hypothetical protein